MPSHPTHHHTRPLPHRQTRRAFTLVEVLIVVAIIVALAAISVFVGGAVKRSSASRATRTTLHTLHGLMDTYLKAGNPEPPGNDVVPNGAPKADSINFVKALRASAGSSGILQTLKFGDDGSPAKNATIVDGFGNAIRFVPSNDPKAANQPNPNNTAVRWYFLSAGPDGTLFNTNPPPPDFTADNVSSLDNY